MDHSIRCLEDNSDESNVDYTYPPKEGMKNISSVYRNHSCDSLERRDALCSHPTNFPNVKLKCSELLSVVEEMSRKPDIDSAAL